MTHRIGLRGSAATLPRRACPPGGVWVKILIALAVLLVALAGAVAVFLPSIAASLAPNMIVGAAQGQMAGTLSVDKVSVSWRGPQTIQSLKVKDPNGKLVAEVSASATTSLISLALGSRDLGAVTIKGKADIVQTSQGSTLQQALAPPPKPPGAAPGRPAAATGGPSTLPGTLALHVIVDSLDLTYEDPTNAMPGGVRAASLKGVKGDLSLAVGKPLTAVLNASGQADGKPVSIALDATVMNWSTADGKITPELATADARADVSAPAALLAGLFAGPGVAEPARTIISESLAGPEGNLNAQTVTLNLLAKGDAKRLDASLQAKTGGVNVDLALNVANPQSPAGRITLTRPGVVQATITSKMAAAATTPAGANAAAQPALSLEKPVLATVRIDSADLPVMSKGLDLRGGRFVAALETSAIDGVVRTDGTDPMTLRTDPITATIASEDLGKGVTLKAAGAATLDGRPAGSLSIDLAALGVLDDKGAPRPGMPTSLTGRASIKGLATAIAKPFVKAGALDIERDVGRTLDAVIDASTVAGAGGATTTSITLTADASNLDVKGSLTTDGKTVATSGEGVTATLQNVGGFLAAMLKDAGLAVRSGGPVTLALTGLEAPVAGASPDKIKARLRAEIGGLTMLVDKAREQIDLRAVAAEATLAPATPVRAVVSSTASFNGAPFEVAADMTVAGLFAKDGAFNAAGARPVGTVRVVNAPTALLSLAGASKEIMITRDLLGRMMTLQISAADGASGSDITAELKSDGLTTQAKAALTPERIEMRGVTGVATLTPALLARAMEVYAPDVRQRPSLAGPTPLRFEVGPVAIPMKQGKPDMPNATPIKASLSMQAPLSVRDIDLGGERPADLGVRGLTVEATWALNDGGPRTADVRADVFDPRGGESGAPLARVVAAANISRPDAPEFTAKVSDINASGVDAMLAMPGLLDLSLGSPATVTASLKPQRAAGAARQADVAIASPRLTTSAGLEIRPDLAVLTKPMDVAWTMDRRWAARYLTPARGGAKPAVTFTGDTDITARVERLAISLGEGSGPLRPGAFDLAARAAIKRVDLATAEGEPLRIGSIDAAVQSSGAGAADQAINLDLTMRDVTGGGAGGGVGQTKVAGRVTRFADPSGKPAPDTAEATLDAEGRLPTALVDALGGGQGRILELLGMTTDVKAQARGLSRAGGTLSASMGAPRADAAIDGRVRDGVFFASKPVTATVREITRRLSEMVIEPSFPLLTKFEKAREDGPAALTITGLELPIRPEISSRPGGPPDQVDLRKLNGEVRLELGRVRYTSGDLVGRIMNLKGMKSEGSMFNRFPPIDVKITNGVARYEKTSFPIGEFTIETRGSVDLVDRTMDLIVWAPLVGVADEFLGVFRSVPGLNQTANVPFRIKGPFDSAVPVPAPDLILKDALGDIKKDPKKVIENVGGAIEDLLKRKKN